MACWNTEGGESSCCRSSVRLCSQLCGLVAASVAILGRQHGVTVPISSCWHGGILVRGFGRCHGGKLSSWGTGQPWTV